MTEQTKMVIFNEAHIRLLLEKYDLVPNRGISLAAATVLAESYLNKRKAAEMRLFRDTAVSIF